MLWKTDQIIELIEFVEGVVAERTKQFFLFSSSIDACLLISYTFILVGCHISSETTAIYTKWADTNKTIVLIGFGYVLITNAFAHGGPALCPLMYWLFGAPTPDKWILPVQTNKA